MPNASVPSWAAALTSPTRRRWLQVALGLSATSCWPALAALAGAGAGAVASARASTASTLVWRERMLLGFGTTLWLRAAHPDGVRAAAALDAAVQALRHVERQMSLFDPDSALQRLNRDGHLERPDPHLLAVLQLAQRVAAGSGGAFDVTVQPLWATWQQAHAEQRLPSAAQLRAVQGRIGWRHLSVTPQRIALQRDGMALTLNGIAQGYAADLARAALLRHGIAHALIDAGEWRALGDAPDARPWSLGIADPRDATRLIARVRPRDGGIATSSDAQLAFTDDRREHHILDPRRGHSPPRIASVTVAAPSAALADALTKVVFMAGWHEGLRVAHRWGASALIVDKAGAWQASPGFVSPA